VDAARRVRRQALREEPLDPHQVGGVESGADTCLRVSTALQQLPERQRKVIELLKIQGWKAKDVASALGLSVANVKIIAHRGYHALRRTLKDEA
jgi:RNA polymerase sigma-70 factor (ECF subfamily)